MQIVKVFLDQLHEDKHCAYLILKKDGDDNRYIREYSYDNKHTMNSTMNILKGVVGWEFISSIGSLPIKELYGHELYRLSMVERDFISYVIGDMRDMDKAEVYREDFYLGKEKPNSLRYFRQCLYSIRMELNETYAGMASVIGVTGSAYARFELGDGLPDRVNAASAAVRLGRTDKEKVNIFRAYLYDWCIVNKRKNDYGLLLSVIRLVLGEDINTMSRVSGVNWPDFERGKAPKNYPQVILEREFGVPDYYEYSEQRHTVKDIVELGLSLGMKRRERHTG